MQYLVPQHIRAQLKRKRLSTASDIVATGYAAFQGWPIHVVHLHVRCHCPTAPQRQISTTKGSRQDLMFWTPWPFLPVRLRRRANQGSGEVGSLACHSPIQPWNLPLRLWNQSQFLPMIPTYTVGIYGHRSCIYIQVHAYVCMHRPSRAGTVSRRLVSPFLSYCFACLRWKSCDEHLKHYCKDAMTWMRGENDQTRSWYRYFSFCLFLLQQPPPRVRSVSAWQREWDRETGNGKRNQSQKWVRG